MNTYSDGYVMLAAFASLLLIVPFVALAGSAARLAASRRDARLAALRLAGATTAQVTKLTALDAGGQALLGALVGMAGYFALIPAIMLLDFQNQHFTFEQLWVGLPALAAVTVGVTLLALVSALAALRRVAFTPLGVTQRIGQPMPSAWRALIFLAVLAVGYLLLNSISAFAHLGQMVVYAIIFGVFFLGFAMVNVVGTWWWRCAPDRVRNTRRTRPL